jgi:hypothetical protein
MPANVLARYRVLVAEDERPGRNSRKRPKEAKVVDDLRAVDFAGLPHRPSFLHNHQEIVPCFDSVYWPAR